MKTKHLLTALALPVAFAACTSEDLVQTESIVKEDLGNRPMVEGVTLSLGEDQGRAAIANWGTINFEEGDKLGVALIDVYNTSDSDPVKRYNLLKNSINTNYIFTSDANGDFSSEAAMVEGNYVFYYPYNTQRTRNQIVTNLPKEQALTQLADGTYSSYPSVLAYSEENGAPIAVAYDFLSAADAGNTLQGTLKQIYATPLFTIQNECSKMVNDEPVPQEMTIKQIILSYGTGGKFVLSAPLKFSTGIHNAYSEAVTGHESLVANFFNETITTTLANAGVKKGTWIEPIKGRATSDLIEDDAVENGESTEIILTLAEPVTVAAEGSFSFYAVIPAGAYTGGNQLKVTVMNEEGLSRELTLNDATLTAGQRYPEEEINDDNTLNNDIKGMSLTGAVYDFDALKGVLVSNVDELINTIKGFTYPSSATADEKKLKIHMSDDAVINKRVADFLKLTTTKATDIIFVNDVTIEGTGVVLEPKVNIFFDTKATAVSGAAVTLNSSKVTGDEFIIASGATATYKASGLTAITNNGTLAVEASVTPSVRNNGVMNVTKNATFGTVINGKYSNDENFGGVEAEINVAADKVMTVTTSLTNAPDATINNLGTITGSVVNKGEIVNGSEDDITAVLNITSNDKVADKYTGSIENHAKATVTTQNGKIDMMSVNAVLSVTSGSGLVVNDDLASVTDAAKNMVVTYTISGEQTEETIDVANLKLNGITKLILDGVVLKLSGDLDLAELNVDVIANSSINSATGAAASHTVTLGTAAKQVTLAVSSGKTLTVNAGTILEGNYVKTGTVVNNGTVYDGVMITGADNNEMVEALTAALNGGSNVKVALTADVTLNSLLNIAANKTVKINLNGKTLTGRIESSATLTIENGAIKYNGDEAVKSSSALTMKNVDVEATYTAVNVTGGTANISGGSIKGTQYADGNYALLVHGATSATISNVDFTGNVSGGISIYNTTVSLAGTAREPLALDSGNGAVYDLHIAKATVTYNDFVNFASCYLQTKSETGNVEFDSTVNNAKISSGNNEKNHENGFLWTTNAKSLLNALIASDL